MPVFPEEPEIHETIPGPGVPLPHKSDAPAPRMPSATAVAAPVPGPRPGPPRPAPPRADRPVPGPRPAARPKPGPAPRSNRPTVELFSVSAADALDRADEAVDALLEAGRLPGDVLVLTVGEAHPWQQHELSFGEESYWGQLADGGDVFYADAAATRPLRRDVVVLVVNEGRADRVAAAARKALERAAKLLVVCGESEIVGPLFA
ncbi:hypothetical protein AB0K51_28920 [Kitasatospora sp. NPDC049285]|uniref:hypothetical protein n=1 Tax=Kitasatospora sp. NPDC049285 TaxID=3157096 RepID=UPI00341A669A